MRTAATTPTPGAGSFEVTGDDPCARGDGRVIAASLRRPDAFASVADRHAGTLHRYARRRLGARAADGVVSEAMRAAFRARHRYDTARPDARPWLLGILTREITRHRRRERSRYRTMRTSLARALAGLAARERDVLLLVAWADLSHDQVAEGLAIPVHTVRARLDRARRRICAAVPAVRRTPHGMFGGPQADDLDAIFEHVEILDRLLALGAELDGRDLATAEMR